MPARTHDKESDDPLTRALKAEIAHETEGEQEVRLKKEKEALRVSESIDEDLREEKAALKKTHPVKILLLGQSESGKSTALKNFQIIHTPQAWEAERASWRAVIQLNLIRSVRFILNAMSQAQLRSGSLDPDDPKSPERAASPTFTPEHLYLQTRLQPLLHVEDSLNQRLAPENGESSRLSGAPKLREVAVNALSSWKGVLSKIVHGDSSEGESPAATEARAITSLICSRKDDIRALWTDPEIHDMLKKRKLRIDDLPGFFLDDLDRIASEDYTPSDDDVVRARLKTIGVTEYRFTRETTNVVGSDWRIYDVGGSRTQRAAWAPYFQDVDAMIFLAPISCFDQVLVEDHTINRLEDTVILWKTLCANPLLKKCNIILFMNKADLMDKKLKAGVRLARYIPSYGDRPNDFTTASQYLRRKFQLIFNDQSPEPRPFYCHVTSLTNINASAKVIASVADMIIHSYLRDHALV